MNILRAYAIPALIVLGMLVAFFITSGSLSEYSSQVERADQQSSLAATSLHGMLSADVSTYDGRSAPEEAASAEAQLADQRNALELLRSRIVFQRSSEYATSSIPEEDLSRFYAKHKRALEAALNTTFWLPRELDGGSRSGIGVSFSDTGKMRRQDYEERLWQLDVMRRVFELAVNFRIARVTTFKYLQASLPHIENVAPAGVDLATHRASETEERLPDEFAGFEQVVVEDPFGFVYQPCQIIFVANFVEATNFISEMAREGGGSNKSRPLFPVTWDIERVAENAQGVSRYQVELNFIAVQKVFGTQLDEASLRRVFPSPNDFPRGGR